VRHMRVKPAELTRNVGAAEFLPDRLGHLADSGRCPRAGRCIALWPAPRPSWRPPAIGAFDPLLLSDHDPRPGLGEQPRAGRADAALGAGDDRNLAAKILARSSPPSLSSPASPPRRCYAVPVLSPFPSSDGTKAMIATGIANCGGRPGSGWIRPARGLFGVGAGSCDPADGHPLRHRPADGAGNGAGDGRCRIVLFRSGGTASGWGSICGCRHDRSPQRWSRPIRPPARDRADPHGLRLAFCRVSGLVGGGGRVPDLARVLQQQRRGPALALGLDGYRRLVGASASGFSGSAGHYRADLLTAFLGFARSRAGLGAGAGLPPLWSRCSPTPPRPESIGSSASRWRSAAPARSRRCRPRLPAARAAPAPRLLRPVGGDGICWRCAGEAAGANPAPQFEANGERIHTSGRK